jgi:hypothetical protein
MTLLLIVPPGGLLPVVIWSRRRGLFEAVAHEPHALFQALKRGNHRIHLFHQIAADEVGDQR